MQEMPKKLRKSKPTPSKSPSVDERLLREREAERFRRQLELDEEEREEWEKRLGGHATEEEADEASRHADRELARLDENRD